MMRPRTELIRKEGLSDVLRRATDIDLTLLSGTVLCSCAHDGTSYRSGNRRRFGDEIKNNFASQEVIKDSSQQWAGIAVLYV
jgi:hypothetical protein